MKIIAIDIGGTVIKSGLFTLDDSLISLQEYPTQASKGVSNLLQTLEMIIKENRDDVVGVGISTSGQVNQNTGTIVFATDAIPGYTGTPLKAIMEARTDLPITVDNDVNCAAIGEANYGSGKNFEDFLCLTFGTGIGGAIVINKKIYYGADGVAGEFGHITTHADGIQCVCGKKGCYEAYASTSALIKRVAAQQGANLTGKEIFERISDQRIHQIIDQWIDEIVIGLTSLTHIFNPGCIILGGAVLSQTYVIEEIRRKFASEVIESFSNVEIFQASLGNKAGIYGAYHQAKLQFLQE